MPDFPQIDRAGKWDLFIQQGSTYMRSLNFVEFDITGYKFRGMIKRHHNNRIPLATFDVTPVANNEVEMYLSSQESEKLPPGELVHDIEIYWPGPTGEDEYVARIIEGKVTVTPEVTR